MLHSDCIEEDLYGFDDKSPDHDLDDTADLEFLLYSQLHYEQDFDIHSSLVSENKPEPPNENPELFSIKSITQNSKSSTNVKLSTNDKSNKIVKSRPVKCKNKAKKRIHIKFSEDSSCSSSDEAPIPKKRRQNENFLEDSAFDPGLSFISVDTDLTDSSEEELYFEDYDSSAGSDSEACSNLDTPHLHVHTDQKLRELQHGGVKRDVDGKWQINETDRVAGIGSRLSGKRFGGTGIGGRYYRPSSVKCHNCNEVGHLSKDCEKPRKSDICILCGVTGHFFRKCPQTLCYNCDRPGHVAKECTAKRQYRYQECHRCGMYGHSYQNCPDLWRQFHVTTSVSQPCPVKGPTPSTNSRRSCYNCASKAHFGYDCPRDRVDKHSNASYTLVANYDNWKWLKSLFADEVEKNVEKNVKSIPIDKKTKKQKKKDKLKAEKLTVVHPKNVKKNNLKQPKQVVKKEKIEFKKEKMVKPKKSKQKKKGKQKIDYKFSNCPETGKPFRQVKKQRRKEKEIQRQKVLSKQGKQNGFRLSSKAKSLQGKMHR